jgi:PAS domain S-box-containing protein
VPPSPLTLLRRIPNAWAAALLAAGLVLTGLATRASLEATRAEQQADFLVQADRLEGSVTRRLGRAESVLRQAAAGWQAAGGWDRPSFVRYVEQLRRDGELGLLRALGLVEPVPRADLAQFEARERLDGAPGFRLRGAGSADPALVIRMIGPGDLAPLVEGRDLVDDAARRAAIEAAAASGEPTLTAPVTLFDDRAGALAGWVLYLPLYRPGVPLDTPEQRRAALQRLLFTPVAARELLATVRGVQEEQLGFQLWDGSPELGPPLYDSRTGQSSDDDDVQGAFASQRTVQALGRSFTLRIWNERELHGSAARRGPWAVALAGIALSLLAAIGLRALLLLREAAEARARRAQGELRRLEELSQRTTGVVLGLDARLRIVWVNAGYTLLTGWSEADVAGQPAARLLRAGEGEPELAQAADRLRHGASYARIELMLGRKDGSLCWLDADIQPDEDGGGFLLTATDISARRLAEQKLAENEHLMRLMTDNVAARLSYWDTELRCRLANRTMARSYGLKVSQVLGRHITEIMPAETWSQIESRIRLALTGQPQRFERTRTTPGGQVITSLVDYVPDFEHGHVVGVFVFALDITELKQAQEAALAASRAKTQFLSHMSHEIRTPMNAILGMLALLRGTALDGRQGDYVGKAERAARSLLGILNDILDLSKIEAGKLQLDPVPFRFDVLLQDLHSILAGAAGGKPVQLRFTLDPQVPPVLVGDDMRLRQVLVNLGGNAVKFTPVGEVAVAVRLAGSSAGRVRVAVEVRDTGIGIAPDDHERIFSDFNQASAATTRAYGGTGLGLGICRRLVAMMGGRLALDSAPGQGSRFHFELELPVARSDDLPGLPRIAAGPPAAPDGPPQPLAGLRLLVVEDNPVNQQVAQELLAAQGAEVVLAGDGAEGVRLFAQARPRFDAVLMDVQMPVLDGYGATREIRVGLGDRDTPIVAMTANAMADDRERCLEAGMDDHIAKPFELAELVAVLARHLRRVPGRGALPAAEATAVPPATGPGAAAAGTAEPVPAPLAAAAPGAAWDRDTALARLGGDPVLLGRLLPVYSANLRKLGEQLQALRAGTMPAPEAARLFHTLKGTAATMGADALADRAAAAERDLRHAPGADAAALALPVALALDATLVALERERGTELRMEADLEPGDGHLVVRLRGYNMAAGAQEVFARAAEAATAQGTDRLLLDYRALVGAQAAADKALVGQLAAQLLAGRRLAVLLHPWQYHGGSEAAARAGGLTTRAFFGEAEALDWLRAAGADAPA